MSWKIRVPHRSRSDCLLDVADTALVANVSRDTIYREIDRGAPRVQHVGRQLRIDPLNFRHYPGRGAEA